MAVVANQAVAFDKSMLMACPHLGDVLRPGLIPDHGQLGRNRITSGLPTIGTAFERLFLKLRPCCSHPTLS
jgi:hypothetical protein